MKKSKSEKSILRKVSRLNSDKNTLQLCITLAGSRLQLSAVRDGTCCQWFFTMYLELHICPEEKWKCLVLMFYWYVLSIVLLMVNIEIRHSQDIPIKALNYSAAWIAFRPLVWRHGKFDQCMLWTDMGIDIGINVVFCVIRESCCLLI